MSEQSANVVPKGAPAGESTPELSAQVAELSKLVATLATSQQAMLDAVGRLSAPPRGQPAYADTAVEEIRSALAAMTRQQATAARSATRDRYVAEKMKDLPSAYQRLMPESDDAAALARAEAEIRQQYQADFKSAGQKGSAVAGTSPGGSKPSAVIDVARLSAFDRIGLGLQKLPVPSEVSRSNS